MRKKRMDDIGPMKSGRRTRRRDPDMTRREGREREIVIFKESAGGVLCLQGPDRAVSLYT
jgi:hypothetical protein